MTTPTPVILPIIVSLTSFEWKETDQPELGSLSCSSDVGIQVGSRQYILGHSAQENFCYPVMFVFQVVENKSLTTGRIHACSKTLQFDT